MNNSLLPEVVEGKRNGSDVTWGEDTWLANRKTGTMLLLKFPKLAPGIRLRSDGAFTSPDICQESDLAKNGASAPSCLIDDFRRYRKQ